MSSPASAVRNGDHHVNHVIYNRTESTESGWDNPFRPGGDLSREADEIVQLIKGGKPITPTPGAQAPPIPEATPNSVTDGHVSPQKAHELNATPTALANSTPKTNGTTKGSGSEKSPGQLDVQRATVRPDDAEKVTIKKKPKCQCCSIQ